MRMGALRVRCNLDSFWGSLYSSAFLITFVALKKKKREKKPPLINQLVNYSQPPTTRSSLLSFPEKCTQLQNPMTNLL